MAEEISFELKSNLDIIAKEAKVLAQNIDKVYYSFKRKNTALLEQNRLESESVEGVDALQESYDDLRTQVEKVTGSKKRLVGVITNTGNNLEGLRNKINSSNDDWKNGPQNWKMNDDGISSSFEKIMKKVREFENGVQKSILKINSAVYNMGVELTANATNLKPFDLTFTSSFSFNPKQFFGFGGAMKEAFELMKTFQQMKHELASLSDSSGNASKALGLVYDIAGNSSVASATAMSAMRALGDQGILTDDKRFKDLGILSGDLQAATGIAASQWGAFTGELAFNYGLPVDGLENITSALIGTNLRGAQLEKAMQTVNKILQTTAFIAGKPTKDSIEGLTKSVGGAMKTFQAMGISAEKSGGFIEGIVDPENFEKNSFLFAKLGISASDYADTLNDVNGQQKLLDRVMGNLPKLASEITNIKNPFARLQFAKTLGLDMQIVRNMAGKTQGEIEEMIAKFQKENQGKEALEAKRKFMAAEAAKFDDMMLGLRLKVLKPVMDFLTKGYLNNFIAILPKIATTIGTVFEAITPIIETVTTAMLELIPVFTELVNTFVKPFIKMFPEAVNYLLDILQPYLGLLTRDESIIGTGEGNSPSTNKITTVAFNILKLLGQIYLFIIGWKALNLVADGFFKVIGWLKPGKKNLMDTSLDEYIRRMKQIMTPGGGGGGGAMATVGGFLAAGVVSAGLVYLTKKIVGTPTFETFLDREKVKGMSGMEITGEVFKNAGQDAAIRAATTGANSIQQIQTIKEVSDAMKIQKQVMTARGGVDTVTKGAKIVEGGEALFGMAALKAANKSPFMKAFGKVGVGIGVGSDVLSLATGTTRAETWAAGASLASTIVGGIIGGVSGAAAGGVGAVPGAIAGMQIGQLIGVPLGFIAGSIGGFFDAMDEQAGSSKIKMEMLKQGFEDGMTGIFNAFKAGDFETVSKLLSLQLEDMWLSVKAKALSFIPFVGNDSTKARKEADEVMRNAGEALEKFKKGEISRETLNTATGLAKTTLGRLAGPTFSGLSEQTFREYSLTIDRQTVLAEFQLKEARRATDAVKEGNKEQKNHNDWQKQQTAKTDDEKIISSFKFDANTEVFSGQYFFTE